MMLKKLLSLIGLGGKKVIDLDGDGKIETLRAEVEGVFSQFKRMHDKLDKVNTQLNSVIEEEKFAQLCERDNLERIIEEANKKINKMDKVIEKAGLEIQANTKLQEKVKDFIL
jgi:SMC interacting uncharacterized protein involved in chromosome segregation